MNRKRKSYDRVQLGERIRSKRLLLGLSQEELSEKIDRAPTYCSDIERGACGMSIETLISLSKVLDISLDYLIFGESDKEELARCSDDELAITHLISRFPKKKRHLAIDLLKIFLSAVLSS